MRALALLVLFAGAAAAQPMMMNPAQMSGIPRPDPAVPKATLTVRLIRGNLANRIVDREVALVGADGKVVATEKTDPEGRATFKAIPGPGPFVARAKDGDEELTSKEISMPPEVGVRVMLVFGAADGPAADGAARPDKTLPAGTLIVLAQDGGDGKGVAGLDVVVGEGKAGDNKVAEHRGKTGANGEARFDGLTADPKTGYLATVLRDGARFAGKPFRLSGNMGARVTLDVRAVTHDTGQVQIGRGSHFIFEVVDDGIQVGEVWRLQNLGDTAVDVPGGIRIPLPADALSAQVGPNSPPTFSVPKGGKFAVWKGPLPVGDTELQVLFGLPFKSNVLELHQPVDVPFTEVNVVLERTPGVTVDGDFADPEERPLGPKMLLVYRGKSGAAHGSTIDITLRGLPHVDATWRSLTALTAGALFIGFMLWGARGRTHKHRETATLEAERGRLLSELAALDDKSEASTPSKKAKQRRKELVDRLAEVYREIDQTQG